MRLFKKQLVVLTLNVLVFLVLASTISNYTTSYFEGEAATTFSATIKKYNLTASTPSVSDGLLSFGTSDSSLTYSQNTGNATFSVSFAKNSSTTTTLYNNSSGEVRLYPGLTNGGSLTYSISSGYKILSFRIKSSQNPGATINAGTSFTSLDKTENFSALTTQVTLKNVVNQSSGSGNNFRKTEVIMTYESISENDAESYSTNFLTSTENKANCTSDTGWATLESDYNALSTDAKNEFKTNTTNQTILDARARYNYLIGFNNTLNDFVFGV